MRLWVEVDDANGNKLGILLRVKSASITRVLDGVGSIGFEAFATDERAIALMDNERRVRIYVEENRARREIGRGIVRKLKTSIANGGFNLSLDGVDSLDELKRVNTLFNRAYEDSTADTICADLASLAGWSAMVDSSLDNLLTARFDGSSSLKAMQTLAEMQGFHLRTGAARVVEVGDFGEVIDLRLINPSIITAEAYRNPKIAFIESISITEDSETIANRIFVLGAGQNVDAALTLEYSGRHNPYEIKSKYGPDNRLLYYLEDENSIEQYGVIERILAFKEIAPLANSEPSLHRAANMLYDAAKVWLRRNSRPLKSYSLTLKKCEKTIRPGDKVHIVYRGVIDKDGAPYTWKSIDANFWVMKVTESVGLEGKIVRLEVSNIDQFEGSAARIVVGALEQIQVQGIKAQPTFNLAVYGPYIESMDSTHDVTVPLTISDATYSLQLCRLRIKTRPFRSTAQSTQTTADGGGSAPTTSSGGSSTPTTSSGGGSAPTSSNGGEHRHRVMQYDPGDSAGTTQRSYGLASDAAGTGTYYVRFDGPAFDMFTFDADGDHTHDVTIPDHTHDVTIPAHTHDVTIPNHTHALDLAYGINDDTQYPGGVKIRVDGVQVATGLGTTATGIEEVFDITAILNTGTLRRTHDVVIECEEGRGTIEVQFELYGQILPIRLG